MLGSAFNEHKITVTAVTDVQAGTLPDLADFIPNGDTILVDAIVNTPMYVLLLQIFGAYFAYIFGKNLFFYLFIVKDVWHVHSQSKLSLWENLDKNRINIQYI